MQEEPPSHSRDDLPSLEQEYSRVRDDSRSFWTNIAGLLTVAVAIAGGLAALSLQTCPNPSPADSCSAPPAALWLAAPLAPTILSILVIQQIVLATIRANYEQALEQRIVELRPVLVAPPLGGPEENLPPLPVPSYSHITNAFFDIRRAPKGFRPLTITLNVMAGALFLGTFVMCILELPENWFLRGGAIGAYTVIIAILARTLIASLDGPELWRVVVHEAPRIRPPDF